jgi:hypothetical protein
MTDLINTFQPSTAALRARHLARLALWAGAALTVTSASAMSIREFRALEQSDKTQGVIYAQYYLVGAMESVLEVNAHAVRGGAKPIMCTGGKRLQPILAKPMFEAELKRNRDLYEADMPAQLVMLNALVKDYPCP